MASTDPTVAEPGFSTFLSLVAREIDIPRPRRVFVNRNLRMAGIELVGFDMDYTLATYKQREMERLSIELTLGKLVEKHGYPRDILALGYPSEWAIRGLVVDQANGNVFKMDRHGHVGRVFHGRRALTYDERTALYRRERIRLSAPRYAWIDTLFALPEAAIYMGLVEHLGGRSRTDFARLWRDVRASIDEAHRDDSLKSVIRADLPRFVQADPDLAATLHKLRSSGKRLFVLTNSLWDYTDVVMRHVLDGKLAAYPSWRNYFDIVIVGGAKPAFFTDRNPFVELDPATGAAIGTPKGALARGRVYQGGNLVDFEKMAGAQGDRVLYIGDHIYGDILRAKKSSVWRTAMIVQELEDELAVSERFAARLKQIDDLDRKRRNLDAEYDFQQLLLKELQRLGDGPDREASDEDIEIARRQVRKGLDALRATQREVTGQLVHVEDEMDRAYNPHWGPVFKEGNETSRFGEQVEDYACVYTSRVSNFLYYSPLRYFRAPRGQMAHEM